MKNQEIEHLRACAILLVIMHHFDIFGKTLPVFGATWVGVDLFFLISGYVVSRSILSRYPTFTSQMRFVDRVELSRAVLRDFFIRRFFRIAPLAVVWMAVPLLCAALANQSKTFGTMDNLITCVVSILTLQFNYVWVLGPGFVDGLGVLNPYWSLNVEEQFYLLLPLFLLLFWNTNSRILATLSAILFFGLVLTPWLTPDVQGSTNPGAAMSLYNISASHRKFDALFGGVLIGMIRDYGWGDSLRALPAAWLKGASLVCLALLVLVPVYLPFEYAHGNGLISVAVLSGILVFLASFQQGWVFDFPVLKKLLRYVGSRSFALYLSHMVAKKLVIEALFRWDPSTVKIVSDDLPYMYWPVVLALTLVFSELSYRWIEVPFIERGRQLIESFGPAPLPGTVLASTVPGHTGTTAPSGSYSPTPAMAFSGEGFQK